MRNKEINLDALLGDHDYLEGIKSEEAIKFSKLKSKSNTEFDEGGITWFIMKSLQVYDKSFYEYLLKKNIDPVNPIAIDRNKDIISSSQNKTNSFIQVLFY